MDAEKNFWSHVTTNTPHAVDGSEATTETLKAMFPAGQSTTVDLFGYETCLTQYMSYKDQIDELTKLKEEAANRVKAYMGDSARAEGHHYKVSWASQTRNTFDVKKFQKDYGDIDLSPYYKTTSSRVFKVSQK
jgi:predicted phage-related endonuclease